MKKIILLLSVIACSVTMFGQEEQTSPNEMQTIFGKVESHGGYGGLSFGYTNLDKRDVAVFNARGAWLINHNFGIGFSGTGFVSTYRYDNALASDAFISGGYGGLMFEYILKPMSPVHLSFPVVIGAGGVAYMKKPLEMNDYNDHQYNPEDADPFAFIKPGIEVELNMMRYFRCSIGAYYMQTSNVNLINTSSGLLNGFSGMINFKFGKF